VTFVTGLWNVARGDMVIFKRTFDYYLSYLRDVLQIKDNIIMFGNQELKTFVEQNQKYKENILFIIKDIKDIEKYWYTAKIGEVI
jgi:2-phosphoglycerate kinase